MSWNHDWQNHPLAGFLWWWERQTCPAIHLHTPWWKPIIGKNQRTGTPESSPTIFRDTYACVLRTATFWSWCQSCSNTSWTRWNHHILIIMDNRFQYWDKIMPVDVWHILLTRLLRFHPCVRSSNPWLQRRVGKYHGWGGVCSKDRSSLAGWGCDVFSVRLHL